MEIMQQFGQLLLGIELGALIVLPLAPAKWKLKDLHPPHP
jgi:hypothetical protein